MSTDDWPASAIASTSQLKQNTPTRRQSRSSGLLSKNYESFTRTLSNHESIEFKVGDGVVLAQDTPTRQRWLGIPSKKLSSKIGSDGLRQLEKVAIIIGLYEDERDVKMARLRWFVRPKLLLDDIDDEDVHVVSS